MNNAVTRLQGHFDSFHPLAWSVPWTPTWKSCQMFSKAAVPFTFRPREPSNRLGLGLISAALGFRDGKARGVKATAASPHASQGYSRPATAPRSNRLRRTPGSLGDLSSLLREQRSLGASGRGGGVWGWSSAGGHPAGSPLTCRFQRILG